MKTIKDILEQFDDSVGVKDLVVNAVDINYFIRKSIEEVFKETMVEEISSIHYETNCEHCARNDVINEIQAKQKKFLTL